MLYGSFVFFLDDLHIWNHFRGLRDRRGPLPLSQFSSASSDIFKTFLGVEMVHRSRFIKIFLLAKESVDRIKFFGVIFLPKRVPLADDSFFFCRWLVSFWKNKAFNFKLKRSEHLLDLQSQLLPKYIIRNTPWVESSSYDMFHLDNEVLDKIHSLGSASSGRFFFFHFVLS